MTPEQIALKAYREKNAALAAICDAAGEPLYEKRGFCPADGCKPSVIRRARVYMAKDERVLVEELEVRQFFRRRSHSSTIREATGIPDGQSIADAFIESPYL
jgi:hypothetical protein